MAVPIRPEDLPPVPSLGLNDALIVDTGSGVFKATPADIRGLLSTTFTTLAAFKAAPITNKVQVLQDPSIQFGSFNWETANAPYTADNVNVIKADSTALSVGAWVRQDADSVTFGAGTVDSAVVKQPGFFGSTATPTAAAATLSTALTSLGTGGELVNQAPVNLGTAPVANDGVEITGSPFYFDNGDGGGKRPQNYWGRDRQTHFGREHLARLYYLLDTGGAASIGIVGNSHGAGYVGAALATLLDALPNVSVTNYSVSGTIEEDWLNATGSFAVGQPDYTKRFAAVMAANHDAIISFYDGTNEPYLGKTLAQALATKRATLTAIRNAHPFGQTGVLQITANAQRDGAGNRDPLWQSRYNAGVRQIVQYPTFGTALFDLTAELPDPFPDFNPGGFQYRWIDPPGVHTQYAHTTIATNMIYEWLIPSVYRPAGAEFGQVTPASGFTLPLVDKMYALKLDKGYIGNGYVEMTSPAALTPGQLIATFPIGYRPLHRGCVSLTLFSSGTWESGIGAQILPDGTMTVLEASVMSPDRVYLAGSWTAVNSL